jgi:hypothetical protein
MPFLILIPFAFSLSPNTQEGASPSIRIPTLQRLDPAYLKRAHEETAAYAQARQPVTLKSGLNDYRCVLHAHSDLSHDSRGTVKEIAEAAKAEGVAAVFLTNHPKKEVDVVAAGPKGVVDGILFFSGAEANGFLLFPGDGKLPPLDVPDQALVDSVNRTGGMVFVAHPEEHKDWSLTGLTGMEIYNTHADLMDERELLAALQPEDSQGYVRLFSILNAIHDYPQEGFACLFDAPSENLAHYDALAKSRVFTAIAANDSHQNTGFVLRGTSDGKIQVEDALGEKIGMLDQEKQPLLKTLLGDPKPGREMLRRILDPYPVSFHYVSTHVLAPDRTPAALKEALKAGRTYVAFDWIADPTGTAFLASAEGRTWTIGDTVKMRPGLELRAVVPLPSTLRLLRDGREVARVTGRTLAYQPAEPGVYRLEAALPLGGELRPWIYTGAIRVVEK